jgi:hypothetical protein
MKVFYGERDRKRMERLVVERLFAIAVLLKNKEQRRYLNRPAPVSAGSYAF